MKANTPFFSLILGTLNRSKEIKILLDSLKKQTFDSFELIVIDQSDNDDTLEIIESKEYGIINIIYKKANIRGLSNARNIALSYASGQYCCLVDDDASYDQNYLLTAYKFLINHKKCILSAYMWNPLKKRSLCDINKLKNNKRLTIRKILRAAPSPGLIFPKVLFDQGIAFDPLLGVGSSFGACEETDAILCAIDLGYKVIYLSDLIVCHPAIEHSFEIENNSFDRRLVNYSRGLGALIKKDFRIRKKKRLFFFLIEKRIKTIIKSSGLLGGNLKNKGQLEWNGIRAGYIEYKGENPYKWIV